jgi:uncharacterized protein YjbI with pentapeptide repeats
LRNAKIDTNTVTDAKTRLIWEIVNPGVAGRNLSSRDLRDAVLVRGDLSSCILTNTDFSLSFLIEANLSNANLTDARLFGVDLTSANLSGSDLTRANLRTATTDSTDFTNAIFKDTVMPDGTVRSSPPLSGTAAGVTVTPRPWRLRKPM